MKRSRLNPINRERRARLRAEQFGDADRRLVIAHMACVCGGKHQACTGGFSEPSHVVSRGAGGKAERVAPMSTGCHRAWHQHGRETWLEVVGWTNTELDEAVARAQAELEARLDREE